MCRTPTVCGGEPRIKRHDVDSLVLLPLVIFVFTVA